MAHVAFISYSSKDKSIADAVVTGLENNGIHCWIAPFNITPGSYRALLVSGNSNQSKQVIL